MFFDYNGNGVQDGEEPPVVGASVQLKDDVGNMVAESLTDSSGDYVLEDVRTGSYKLHVEADKKFRYMCRSTDEFTAVSEGYNVQLDRTQTADIGLMEGFLTLPFPKSVPIYVDVKRGDYFDHDPGLGAIWWDGEKWPPFNPPKHGPPNVHSGTDFFMRKGIELKAAVGGVVEKIVTNPGEAFCVDVSIGYGYWTSYIHVDKALVSVGQKVERGQPVALSGDTGSPGTPHLHFNLWRIMPDGISYFIDPYSPIAGVPKGAWAHNPEDGTWYWYPSDEEWISQGYWTKLNDPRYSA